MTILQGNTFFKHITLINVSRTGRDPHVTFRVKYCSRYEHFARFENDPWVTTEQANLIIFVFENLSVLIDVNKLYYVVKLISVSSVCDQGNH